MSFLAQHATDVVTRVSIENDTKTVKGGQLWQEELLPTETVLVSMLGVLSNGKATPQDVVQAVGELAKCPIQLGGKATVGRGRCQLVLPSGGAR
jgi:CRISPR-associated protein Cmr4